MGIGGGATYVSGIMVNPPTNGLTVFQNLPVIGADNEGIGTAIRPLVINFPAAGSYPYEIDYSESTGQGISLGLMIGSGANVPMPPTGALGLTPVSPASLATGQTQTFTVQVIDATGAAIPNVTILLLVSGANTRQLTATTDSTGHATFNYTGTNAGTDNVQASATISGLGEYSNTASMTWTVPQGGGSIVFVPQG